MTTARELVDQGRYAEAVAMIDGSMVDANTIIAYGKALEMTGQPEAAAALYKGLHDSSPCEAFANQYAACLARVGLRDGDTLDQLLAAYPDNKFLRAAKGEMALKDGDLSAGFEYQADRFAVGGAYTVRDQIKLPDWDGGPLDSRLLVVGEQGLGEEVLFASSFNHLPSSVISCDQRLTNLFTRSFPQHVFTHKSALRFNHGSACCHAMDAFAKAGNQSEPWLKPNNELSAKMRAMMVEAFPGKTLVGLSWFSARKNLSESKSIPVAALPGLFSDSRAMFNLQYGNILPDVQWLESQGHNVYALDGIDVTNDLDALAALIDALDVVVTCSNTVAHFAGALGKRTILCAPDRFGLWYWGNGDRTRWYPSVEIHRNRGDWAELINSVAKTLDLIPKQ